MTLSLTHLSEHTDEELKARFQTMDENNNNRIDLDEFIRFSLRDALARSSARVIDLFRDWDDDESGAVDLKEFRKAINALGFEAPNEEIEGVFKQLDKDGNPRLLLASSSPPPRLLLASSPATRLTRSPHTSSTPLASHLLLHRTSPPRHLTLTGSGQLEYKELNKMLRSGAGSTLDAALLPGAMGEIKAKGENKHALRRGKMSGKKNGVLATSVKLAPVEDGMSVIDQLST